MLFGSHCCHIATEFAEGIKDNKNACKGTQEMPQSRSTALEDKLS